MSDPRSPLRAPAPLRSMNLIWGYMGVGIGLSLTWLDFSGWDIVRALAIILAAVNAGLYAQLALLYGNRVWPSAPDIFHRYASPSSYWLLALGMLLIAAAVVCNAEANAGTPPPSALYLAFAVAALAILASWAILRLRAVRALGELDE